MFLDPNVRRDEPQPLGRDGCISASGVAMGPERSPEGVGSIPGSSGQRVRAGPSYPIDI